MSVNNNTKNYEFCYLEWDSNFFGLSCGKLIMTNELSKEEQQEIFYYLKKYNFVSIENKNGNPRNAEFIGIYTSAYLADVNIQFGKKLKESKSQTDSDYHIQIMRSDYGQKYRDVLEAMTDFQYSKFITDNQFKKRNGKDVYKQWLINGLRSDKKHLAICSDIKANIMGYLLFSMCDDLCVIELVATSSNYRNRGIGAIMVSLVEEKAKMEGCYEL
ncbi:MAG: GNAT family N-acetyltransferase, partial [Firmicutes bacterium]|nr:GNAT family N-acetyltransferase [Bacillota bacterium]